VFSGHQYERAPAIECDLDRPAAGVLLKRSQLAQELKKNRRRAHGDRPLFGSVA
jgi:hypothetical protein